MAFERSPEGQSNRALFLGVDITVYVEGGNEESEFDEGFDMAFWHKAIAAVEHGIRLRIIPKGGKENLVALAEDIIAKDVKRTLVAMDSDYDDWLGRKITDPRVLYTFDYSFENDIFDREGILETFFALCPLCRTQVGVEAKIDLHISDFCCSFRWPHRADIYCVQVGVKGLDRDKPHKYLASNAYGAAPEASLPRLQAEVTRMKGALRGQAGLKVWDCFQLKNSIGHIWEVWAYRLITHLQTLFSRMPKVTYHAVTSAAIAAFGSRLQSPSQAPMLDYYRKQVVSAVIAAS